MLAKGQFNLHACFLDTYFFFYQAEKQIRQLLVFTEYPVHLFLSLRRLRMQVMKDKFHLFGQN